VRRFRVFIQFTRTRAKKDWSKPPPAGLNFRGNYQRPFLKGLLMPSFLSLTIDHPLDQDIDTILKMLFGILRKGGAFVVLPPFQMM
jgi:hypothetical protein